MRKSLITIGLAAASIAGVAALAGCGTAAATTHPAQAPAHSATAAPHKKTMRPAPPAPVALPLPVVPTGLNQSDMPAVRPSEIGLSEDGNGWLRGLSWSSWTAARATGTGYINLDNGSPNMAQGTTVDVSVSVVLSHPTISDHPLFTRMVVTDDKGNSNTYRYFHGFMESTSDGLAADNAPAVPSPPPAPAPSATSSVYPQSGDPVPGSATGPACTTVAGMFPGGEPGHRDAMGFCVPDK